MPKPSSYLPSSFSCAPSLPSSTVSGSATTRTSTPSHDFNPVFSLRRLHPPLTSHYHTRPSHFLIVFTPTASRRRRSGTPSTAARVTRANFASLTSQSLLPSAEFTDHESIPSLDDAKRNFLAYADSDTADLIRNREYRSLSAHVCLDYYGLGLFSHAQGRSMAAPLPSTSYYSYSNFKHPPSFTIACESTSLRSQVLGGAKPAAAAVGWSRRSDGDSQPLDFVDVETTRSFSGPISTPLSVQGYAAMMGNGAKSLQQSGSKKRDNSENGRGGGIGASEIREAEATSDDGLGGESPTTIITPFAFQTPPTQPHARRQRHYPRR